MEEFRQGFPCLREKKKKVLFTEKSKKSVGEKKEPADTKGSGR